jgi:signal transduction histidine kinase
MEDLALHVLDVAENSIRAGATHIRVRLIEIPLENLLILEIEDDGCGMDEETRKKAASPFYTGKSGKRFGLGLPLLAQAAEATGGHLDLQSEPGKGTRVHAVFHAAHIDMKPLGDFAKTLRVLQASYPDIEFEFEYREEPGDR